MCVNCSPLDSLRVSLGEDGNGEHKNLDILSAVISLRSLVSAIENGIQNRHLGIAGHDMLRRYSLFSRKFY